ncbi:MAG: exosortase K [Candidatus Eisenbacteria bacterium]
MPLAFLSIAGVCALSLKFFYSRATPDQLNWMLAPTARLTSWLTGAGFEQEIGRGYLSRELHFEILPACAGVNFAIVAFVALCWILRREADCPRALIRTVLASATIAYGTTIVANAIRLTLLLGVHAGRIAVPGLSRDSLPAAIGLLIYFLFLAVLAEASAAFGRNRRASTR